MQINKAKKMVGAASKNINIPASIITAIALKVSFLLYSGRSIKA